VKALPAWKCKKQVRKYPRIALFGDTHFQDRGLSRIVKSSNWIIEEVVSRKCDAVICLGDVLNTRELVSVRALSEALSFFDRFALRLDGTPLHILLGNHDINLKHSRKFSSLDALSLNAMQKSGITLHRDLSILPNFFPNLNAIFLPYHEDQSDIIQFLDEYANRTPKETQTLVFGHLAVSGAQQNHSPYRYRGPLRSSSFAPFKRTFSGHFHHHHELARNRIVYVGSPMQFNFGDAKAVRGIVIYDTETDTYELVPNPFGEQYLKENESNLSSELSALLSTPPFSELQKTIGKNRLSSLRSDDIPENRFKDKFVQIHLESSDLSNQTFDSLRESLLLLGAAGVSKSVRDIRSLIKDHEQDMPSTDTPHLKHFGTSTAEDIESIIINFAKSVQKAHLAALEAKKLADSKLASNEVETLPSKTTKSRNKRNSLDPVLESPEEVRDESEILSLLDHPSPRGKSGRRRHTIVQKQSLHFLEDEAQFAKLVALGIELATKSAPSAPGGGTSHTTFKGRLHTLYMKNFMGIQGELTIPFYSMNSGIWLIEGKNGAGKSTVFEALVWAQFGEFLRSGMQKDYAINDGARQCTVRLVYDNGLVIERSRRRGRNEALRTYQLKNPEEHGSQYADVFKSGNNVDDDGDDELLIDRPVTSFDGKIGKDESIKSMKKGKKSKSKQHESGMVKSTKIHPKMQYEPEAELGDIRNTQSLLSERLGVDFETFTKSVVLGQNILNNFVSGNKDMRRSIIEEMLGLEKFNEWLETARKERAKLDENLKLFLQRKMMLQSDLHGINSTTDEKAIVIERKKQDLKALHAKRDEIETSVSKHISLLEDHIVLQKGQLASEEIISLAAELKNLANGENIGVGSSIYSELLSFRSSSLELLQHLLKAKDASNPGQEGDISVLTCGTCGQVVTEEHISKMITQANTMVKEGLKLLEGQYESTPIIRSDTPSALSSYDNLTKVSDLVREYKEKLEQKTSLLEKMRYLELLVSRLETNLAQARVVGSEEKSSIAKDCIACEVELEQLKASRDENRTEQISLEQALMAVETQIEEVKVSLSMTKFWEMAFDKQSKGTVGTVRAFVFEDVVTELNAICNTYMQQLQGKHQYNLRVTLSADLEIEQVYGKRSGGERRRTDLAILFAMFELVRSQSRYVPDFLMLDEVFDALDQEGRDLVGQVLSNLSKRLEKILVITHTDVASGLSAAGTMDVHMPYDPLGNATGTEISICHR
jgi:DNA repair exonuclease SbcCD ATPase subunit/predicted phosphodiesterase